MRGRQQWTEERPIWENAILHKSQGFFTKSVRVKRSATETLWSGISKPQVWKSSTSLAGALNHKNTELYNRPGHGKIWRIPLTPCTTSSPKTKKYGIRLWWSSGPSLYEKYSINSRIQGIINGITTPGDVKLLIDFLKDLQTDWDRWSVVFGGLGTAMVALSAVLSGSAVLSSDYGVKCEKARSGGAVDTCSFLSSQIQAVDHNICIKRRESRAKAKPLQVEAAAIAAPGEASPHPGECSPIDSPFEEDYSKFDVQKALKS